VRTSLQFAGGERFAGISASLTKDIELAGADQPKGRKSAKKMVGLRFSPNPTLHFYQGPFRLFQAKQQIREAVIRQSA